MRLSCSRATSLESSISAMLGGKHHVRSYIVAKVQNNHLPIHLFIINNYFKVKGKASVFAGTSVLIHSYIFT